MSTKQQSLSLTVHQLDSVCGQLIEKGCADQACKVVLAFLQQRQTDYGAVRRCIEALLAMDDMDSLNLLVHRLKHALPSDVRTWKLVYMAAHGMRDQAMAWEALNRAEKIGPVTTDIIAGKAEICEQRFQPEKALSLLEGVTPEDVEMTARVLRVRVSALEQLKRGDEGIPLLKGFLIDAPDGRGVARAFKLLGKLLDKEKRYEEAFSAWRSGNEMMLRIAGEPLEENPVRLRIKAFERVFTAEWVSSWSKVEAAQRTPVFLVGFPRSGTTLLEQVLDSHPDIIALEERGGLDHAINFVDREILGNSYPGGYDRSAGYDYRKLADLTPEQIEQVRSVYFSEMERHIDLRKGKCFIDKMPMNLYLVGFIQRIFPGAKFILALRHPADSVLSAWSQSFNLNIAMMHMLSLDSAARLHRDMFALLEQIKGVLGLGDQIHEIRYEDLVGDFEASAQGILNFLGLPWDEAVVNYHEHARGRAIATPSYQGVTQKLYRSAMERWRNYEQELRPVMPYFADSVRRYGYDLS